MNTITVEVPADERATMIDALAREALLDLAALRTHLEDLTVNADPSQGLIADCVSSSKLVTDDLAAFRRIATAAGRAREIAAPSVDDEP